MYFNTEYVYPSVPGLVLQVVVFSAAVSSLRVIGMSSLVDSSSVSLIEEYHLLKIRIVLRFCLVS